jgi:thiazole/oxazole-forming peptide maturase SagD family component
VLQGPRVIEIQPIEPDDPTFDLVPAALRTLSPRVARCFRIVGGYAPGLVIAGAEITLSPEDAAANGAATLSATGAGVTLRAALTACFGEAAELLAQFEQPGDVAAVLSRREAAAQASACETGWIGHALTTNPETRPIAWTRAHDETTGQPVIIPSDLCLRRDPHVRAIEPIGALSSGCAAGPALDAAKLRATLELIERDAAALWWYGGRQPGPVASHVQAAGEALLAALRQGATPRRTTLLDLTTELAVPVIAAISSDADGRGFACGLGCRLNAEDAAEAAIRELCQMELSAPLAAMKRTARGEAALNAADRRHLQRAAFGSNVCRLLVPHPYETESAMPPGDWLALIARLQRYGMRLITADLTRADTGVPVLRALAPELQPFVPEPVTPRLAQAIQVHGGGRLHTHGTPLL